jgi:hypothetical protein
MPHQAEDAKTPRDESTLVLASPHEKQVHPEPQVATVQVVLQSKGGLATGPRGWGNEDDRSKRRN